MNGGIGPRDPSKSIQIPTSLRRHAKVSCFVSAKPWQSRGSQRGPRSCSYFSLITLAWMFRHPVYSIQPCSSLFSMSCRHRKAHDTHASAPESSLVSIFQRLSAHRCCFPTRKSGKRLLMASLRLCSSASSRRTGPTENTFLDMLDASSPKTS